MACDPGRCTRPWLKIDGDAGSLRFDSVAAAYLSIGPGARVLKSWKTSPSPSLTRFRLGGIRSYLGDFDSRRPLLVIPVPQSAPRRWELAGGSVMRLCTMIREARAHPSDRTLDLLEVGDRATSSDPGPAQNQARARGDDRYSRHAAIRARGLTTLEEARLTPEDLDGNPQLVLVDDFLTSGSTLRAAAGKVREKLGELGWFGGRNARLAIFVLGFRPALFAENRN